MSKIWLLFPEKLIRLLNGVIVTLYAARTLSVSEFVVVAQGFIVLSLFSNILASSPLKSEWIRLYQKEQDFERLYSLFIGVSVISSIAAILYIFVIGFSIVEFAYLLPLTFIGGIQFFSVSRWKCEADGEWAFLARADTSILLVSFGLKLCSLYFFKSILVYGIIIFMENLLMLLHPLRKSPVRHLELDLISFKQLLFKYYKYLSIVILSLLYVKLDQIILTLISDDIEFSLYSLGVRVNDLIYIIPVVLVSFLSPGIYGADNRLDERRRKRKLFYLLIVSSLVYILIVNIFPDVLFERVVSMKYKQSLSLIRILSWSSIAVFIGYYWSIEVILNDLQSQYILAYIIGMFITVVGSLLVYPYYGVSGLAWVTVIGFSVSSLFGLVRYSFVELLETLRC